MGSKMQSQPSTAANLSALYEEDFFEWTQRNAELLRAGHVQHIAAAILDPDLRPRIQ